MIEGFYDHQPRYPSLKAKIILIFFFQTGGVSVKLEHFVPLFWEKKNWIFIFVDCTANTNTNLASTSKNCFFVWIMINVSK